MILLLNTVKLVLIALNIIPNRIRHKKIMFFIYMGTLVTHGKRAFLTQPPPSSTVTTAEITVVMVVGTVIYEK